MSVQQTVLTHVLSYTKLSRTIAGVLTVTYLIGLVSPSSRQYIALVPGRFIPCVWNILTAGILELYFLKVHRRLLHLQTCMTIANGWCCCGVVDICLMPS